MQRWLFCVHLPLNVYALAETVLIAVLSLTAPVTDRMGSLDAQASTCTRNGASPNEAERFQGTFTAQMRVPVS